MSYSHLRREQTAAESTRIATRSLNPSRPISRARSGVPALAGLYNLGLIHRAALEFRRQTADR